MFVFQSVGVAFEGENVGVVDEAVDGQKIHVLAKETIAQIAQNALDRNRGRNGKIDIRSRSRLFVKKTKRPNSLFRNSSITSSAQWVSWPTRTSEKMTTKAR